jgi:hypothetical protein
MKLTPKQQADRPGFRVTFRHPATKKLICAGLGTADSLTADAICRDIESIFADSTLLEDGKSPRLAVYHKRAREVIFGKKMADAVEAQIQTPVLTADDVGTLASRILGAFNKAPAPRRSSILVELLKGYESRRYRELNEKFKSLENVVKALKPRAEALEVENQRLKRQYNIHVKTTVDEAVSTWMPEYKKGVAQITYRQAVEYHKVSIRSHATI